MESPFKIVYDPLVVREDLASLDRSQLRHIKRSIESKLTVLPDVYGKPLRGPLRGYWSLRVGHYRIAYHIESHTVHIDVIEHRSRAYKALQARI